MIMDGAVVYDVDVPALEQIVRLMEQVPATDRQRLIEQLVQRFQSDGALRKTGGFRGIWRARFPEDIDLDDCLQRIRNESKRELEEIA